MTHFYPKNHEILSHPPKRVRQRIMVSQWLRTSADTSTTGRLGVVQWFSVVARHENS